MPNNQIFPLNPTLGQHYVIDNRLWVYTSYPDPDNLGLTLNRWELWGNLTYVPVPGDTGNTGGDGTDGTQGATGVRGTPGPIGATGIKGATGDQGEAGSSLTLKGRLTDFNDLWVLAGQPTAPNYFPSVTPLAKPGDMYIVNKGNTEYEPGKGPIALDDSLNGHTWVYTLDGVDDEYPLVQPWMYVGPISGPQGEHGATGETGEEGPTGPRGATGSVGLNGAHGGAFCHMVDVVPAKGPAGKLYMTKSDYMIYVTTGA